MRDRSSGGGENRANGEEEDEDSGHGIMMNMRCEVAEGILLKYNNAVTFHGGLLSQQEGS